MKNTTFRKVLYLLGIYLVLYFTATFYKSDFWGDILSPIGSWSAFAILFIGYRKTTGKTHIKWSWLLYSVGTFFWAAADTLWLIDAFFLNKNPENSAVIALSYYMTNICIGLGVLIFGAYRFKKWNGIQFILDITTVSVCSIIMVWVFLFQKSFLIVQSIQNYGFLDCISIFSDFMIFVGIVTRWFTTRKIKKPFLARLSSFGLTFYAVADFCFYYNSFYGMYVPNSIVDFLYVAALLLIAVGRYYKLICDQSGNTYWKNMEFNNGRIIRHNGVILLTCPIAVLLFKGFVVFDIFVLLAVILFYEVFSVYVQSAIKNEEMLRQEQRNNILLEHRIHEHTKKLEAKNKELMEKNKELFFLSNQDVVTKLYNRRYFRRVLEEKIETSDSSNAVALLYIDLDRFKTINDTYGHEVGDQVLIEVAARLSEWNRDKALLARLGGDEFVFAFEGNLQYNEMERLAQEIINLCSEEIKIEAYSFHLTISVGISIYPLDASDSSTLMKNADMAMYQAKKTGYNQYFSFSRILTEKTYRNNEIEILLRKADFDKEFQVVYQPQFKIPNRELVGMEALLRWKCPYIGYISPAEFIPIAEEINYIIPIGQWVMKQAIRQIALWNNTYHADFKMGINVSPIQLDSAEFIGEMKARMFDSFVDSKWIDIEITENVAMEGEYRISQIADLIKGLGVTVSIDDFGTGYSSLSYLKLFPSDRIKIAKPLVDSISADDFDQQIVKAIIMLAKSIGMKTIAEGVEHQEQLDILTQLGCEEMQGYLLGKPMPGEEFERLFLSNHVFENKDNQRSAFTEFIMK